MKMPVVLLPAVLVLFGAAAAAHAQSGTITFNGRVTSTTCEVSFNGVIGNDPQIRLPTVSAARSKRGRAQDGRPSMCTLKAMIRSAWRGASGSS